jgi:hypothetical protein
VLISYVRDIIVAKIQGVSQACYSEVDSLEAGEAIVRMAIEQGEAAILAGCTIPHAVL